MYCPPGLRSAVSGVGRAIRSKSSIVEFDAGLVRERQQVQHGVGRSAAGGDGGDRVLERLAGDDVAGAEAARAARPSRAGRPRWRPALCGSRPGPSRAHRARCPALRTPWPSCWPCTGRRKRRRRARRASSRSASSSSVILPAAWAPTRLEDVLDRDVAGPRAGRARSSRRRASRSGTSSARERHHRAGDRLVAAATGDDGVEQVAAATSSIQSAITSRLTSEGLMPSCPS